MLAVGLNRNIMIYNEEKKKKYRTSNMFNILVLKFLPLFGFTCKVNVKPWLPQRVLV